MDGVTLDNIGGGALAELFQAELAKVLANIADHNTDSKPKRSITLKVTLAPNKDRDVADVALECTSKLASVTKVDTRVFMGRQNGKLVAVESDPRQSNLFDGERPKATGTVASISEVRQ